MADILTQSEIDALLSAFSTGEGPLDVVPEEEEKVRQVKVYDFNHPDRFSKDQIRTMHQVHEHFARIFSTSLSAFLRTIVEVKLVSVDQISYEEFIRSIPNPTSLNIISMSPLDGDALMEISPTLAFPIVDRLMGGQAQVFKKNRELTEIEQTIIEKILYKSFDCLHEAWSNVVDNLNPSLEASETNPQLLMQRYLPSEMVILMTFEVTMGEISGTLSFCIPYPTLEQISAKLSSTSWYAASKKELATEKADTLFKRLRQVELPVIAYLGSARLTVRELLELEEGDVIQLDQRTDEDLFVCVGKDYRYRAVAGTHRKKKAVKLTRVLVSREEL